MNKKQIRANFRQACFERDNYTCVMCGVKGIKLDCHHIKDRHYFTNGGYVKENGITLCDVPNGCHWKAEHFHATGKSYPGYSPEDLYTRIGSNEELAGQADGIVLRGA
jgi:5-methylcytosine-specific restriction endonuclease McrA